MEEKQEEDSKESPLIEEENVEFPVPDEEEDKPQDSVEQTSSTNELSETAASEEKQDEDSEEIPLIEEENFEFPEPEEEEKSQPEKIEPIEKFDFTANIGANSFGNISNAKPHKELETLEAVVVNKPIFKEDILLAKKNSFETKLYIQILKSLGYSYAIANTKEDLQETIKTCSYKVVVLDKEFDNINLADFSKELHNANKETKIILIDKSSSQEEVKEEYDFVDEVIRTIVNKELLKSVFEKYIEGN